ncbi:hypothetical protein Lal_00004068 [Lupinus albus]|nr:hypothetical protein Lal_00004068 [Lupinus albus]
MANQIFNPLLNPTSPFYMYPNENPGAVLSRAIPMALETKNKLEFINGAVPKPPIGDPTYTAWSRCNTLVVSWLNQAIDPSIVQSVLWMSTALEIWTDLRERFYQGDVFRISELIGEIHSIKQGSSSISAYYTKIKGL